MLYAAAVFKDVKHRLYKRSVAQSFALIKWYNLSLHITSNTCDHLYSLVPKGIEKVLSYVALVAKELAENALNHLRQSGSIIYIPWRKREGQDMTEVVDD